MYVLGIALAALMALMFRRLIPYFRGRPSMFVMELPMYAVPSLRNVAIHMWERGRLFLTKAGTIIFLGIISVWLLSNYPWEAVHQGGGVLLENSYIGIFGKSVEPIFRLLGFNWMASAALFFGFIAKEIVVGTFATLFGLSESAENLSSVLRAEGIFTPLTGYAFMVFSLIYVPCIATIGVVYRETASWRWAAFTALYQLILAYAAAFSIVAIGEVDRIRMRGKAGSGWMVYYASILGAMYVFFGSAELFLGLRSLLSPSGNASLFGAPADALGGSPRS